MSEYEINDARNRMTKSHWSSGHQTSGKSISEINKAKRSSIKDKNEATAKANRAKADKRQSKRKSASKERQEARAGRQAERKSKRQARKAKNIAASKATRDAKKDKNIGLFSPGAKKALSRLKPKLSAQLRKTVNDSKDKRAPRSPMRTTKAKVSGKSGQEKRNIKKIESLKSKGVKVKTTAKTLKDTKQLKPTGKIKKKHVKEILVTKGGAYPSYKKSSKPAKKFRGAFSKAKKAGKKTFTWQGRSYTTKTK